MPTVRHGSSPVVYSLPDMSALRILQSLFSQQRIAGGALVLALTQFGASLAGLFRDRILASTFPPGIDQMDVVSVYISAFRPSDLLFQMFIMSAFSVALVPLLAGHLAHDRKEEMNTLLSSTLVVGSLFFGVIALVVAIFFDSLAPLLTQFTGERLALYITFGRLACLTNFLFVIGNACGQYLVTKQTYWIYGITPVLYTLGTIAGTLWLTPLYGMMGPMFGTLAGAAIYMIIRFAACMQGGFRFKFTQLVHPEIHEMGWLMLPRMAALGVLQLELLLFDRVASGLDLGSVTISAYARNFQSAAVGIVGIALAQSAYSLLSQAIARGEVQRFWSYLKKGSLLTLALTIPGSIALYLLAPIAAKIVHLTEPSIIHTFIIALGIYSISIPFESLNHLLYRATYATKNTVVPAILTVLGGITAIAIAWMFAGTYGVYAIAWGYVSGYVVQFIGLLIFLKARTKIVTSSDR